MLSNDDPKALIPTLHASAMDFTPTKTPDTDTETPPQTQPLRSFSFRTHHRHHIRLRCPPSSPPHTVAIYKECLRNHAAGLGGYALDGCGEFMPPAAAASLDPTSLKCAACGCHRNFHRRHNPDDSSTTTAPLFLNFHHSSPSDPLSPSPPPMLLDLGDGASPPSEHHQTSAKPESDPSGRKRRHRTKFSQDQKEKMYEFSEKMGWKMRKSDEKMVAEFCNEIGVRRGVLKVWMHNNKNTINGGSSYVNYKKNESINNANYNIDSKIGIHDSDHHVHGLNINGSSSSS